MILPKNLKKTKEEDMVDRFFGDFQSNKNAEEMIDEIHASRNFNRKIVSF